MKNLRSLAALSLLAATVAHAAAPAALSTDPSVANRANLGHALQAFLAQRGDICLAKYDWPIDVSARDIAAGTRDAVQLPVMASQGLVLARPGYVIYKNEAGDEERVSTTRYELTELGRRYFKAGHETVLHPHGGPEVVRRGDFCAGHLDLDSIVRISEPVVAQGQPRTASVAYRYRFTPEAWVRNDAARAVFPMIDKIMKSQGEMLMTQNFHFDGQHWVADTTLE